MFRLVGALFSALVCLPFLASTVPAATPAGEELAIPGAGESLGTAQGHSTAPKPRPPGTRQALQSGVLIVVSIPSQRIFVFKDGEPWGSAPVSTGRRGHDTPVGVFPILEKAVYHRSTLYNDAPMPYMQRLTWGGVALHAGPLPGHRASHGCIRLPRAFARKLFGITSYRSTAVLITRIPVGSVDMARAVGGGHGPAPSDTPRLRAEPEIVPASNGAQTIQLAAAGTAESAGKLWQELLGRRPELAQLHQAIVPATVNARQVFRLRASGPGAGAICNRLASSGTACLQVANW